MAPRTKRMKYIRDIPVPIRQQICGIFDDERALKNWTQLGGLMGFNSNTIALLRMNMARPGGSPTDAMLTEWDHGNHTIDELFSKLHELQHLHCMGLIKELVDPSLHWMISDLQATGPVHNGTACYQFPPNIPPSSNPANDKYFESKYPCQPEGQPYQPNYLQAQPPHKQQSYTQNNNVSPRPPLVVSCHQGSSNPAFPPPDISKLASIRLDPPTQHAQRSIDSSTTSDNMVPQPGQAPTLQYGAAVPMAPPQRYQSQFSPRDDLAPPPGGGMPIDSLSSSSSKAAVYQQGPGTNDSSQSSVDDCLKTTILVPFSQLSEATGHFSERNKLGEGAFGQVYYGQLKMTEVAVKKIIKNDNVAFDQSNIRRDQIKELTALTMYRHKNIVPLHAYSIDGDSLYLIFPYMKNGSLEKKLEMNKHTPLDWALRHRIVEGAASGIHYLHEGKDGKPLIHQDIKSANILLDEHFVAKIADFGLARPGPSQGKEYTAIRTNVVFGTRAYLAPEFTRDVKRKLSTRLDVYSFGVVLMEVVTGEKAGASKQRFKYDNLLTRNVDMIMDEHQKDPEGAVRRLLDPRCQDWPSAHALDLLQLAIRCTDDFKRRPQMEEVLKNLKKRNGIIEEQQNGASRRNVQPTENTEPTDSRPGEESSIPGSTVADQEEHGANSDAWKWGSPAIPPAMSGPDMRRMQPQPRPQPQPQPPREPVPGPAWVYGHYSRYPHPASTINGYASRQQADSTTAPTEYPSTPSPGLPCYHPQGNAYPYQQPNIGGGMPYDHEREARYDPRIGLGVGRPSMPAYDARMPCHLGNGYPQRSPSESFDSGAGDVPQMNRYAAHHHQLPRFENSPSVRGGLTQGSIPTGHLPPAQQLINRGRSSSPSSSSSSEASRYPRMKTLNLDDLSLESSDTSNLTGDTSVPTHSHCSSSSSSSSSDVSHGRGYQATGSDVVTSSSHEATGGLQCQADAGMGEERGVRDDPEEGAMRIPVQNTEPQG